MKAIAKIGSVILNERKYDEYSEVNKTFFKISTEQFTNKEFHDDIIYTFKKQ